MNRALSVVALSGLVVNLSASVNANIITQWNFNSPTGDANTGTGTTTPNIGAGTASLIGGVTSTGFNAGGTGTTAPLSSSDPNNTDDSGWQTTTYPAASVGNRTAGVQFAVNTTGFTGITITFDVRHSNTSANTLRLQYSVDGTNFINADLYTLASTATGLIPAAAGFTPATTGTGDSWYNRRADLSAIAGVNNNPNFAFRVVTEFAPGTSNYLASRASSAYAGGTLRWDMVTINGAVIPTPGAAALLGLGGLAMARRRR